MREASVLLPSHAFSQNRDSCKFGPSTVLRFAEVRSLRVTGATQPELIRRTRSLFHDALRVSGDPGRFTCRSKPEDLLQIALGRGNPCVLSS